MRFGRTCGIGAAALLAGWSAGAAPAAGRFVSVAETVRVGRLDRRFLVCAPPTPRSGAGLLIVFHPSGSNGRRMRALCGRVLEELGGEHNFLVAYPDGYQGHFDDCRRAASYSARRLNIDDVGFSRAIVDRLVRERGIDRSRVYALGYSNGGAMALRLALQAPDLVAGVIAISANLPTADNIDCPIRPSPHLRVVLIEGTSDRINPYAGGKVWFLGFARSSRGNVLSAEASARWFAARDGLPPTPEKGPRLVQRNLSAAWEDWGAPRTQVRLITIYGGGHTIPQAGQDPPKTISRTYRSDDLLRAAWNVIGG